MALGFVDELALLVSSGKGGAGARTFRREKGEPFGGPNGGDGGAGGNVVFTVSNRLRTLVHLRNKKIFKAGDGFPGEPSCRTGKAGGDVVILVPPGTRVLAHPSRVLIQDLCELREGESWVFLQGGRGGRGNYRFRSATRQAPQFAQPGEQGSQREITLELQLIADIGLVGQPNVGKSSLIRLLSNSTSPVGDYPFTTLVPYLGVLSYRGENVVIADIPGILEGASQGVGLGTAFLKHISRTAALLLLIDFSVEDYLPQLAVLQQELRQYDAGLLKRPRLVLATKCDLLEPDSLQERAKTFSSYYVQEELFLISSYTQWGIEVLKERLLSLAAYETDSH